MGDSVSPAAQRDHAILIIDDDPDAREVLITALSGDGYRVDACSGAREALNHLRSHADISVILLNLTTPLIAATQFRTAQMGDRSLAWIPVIVMSAGVDAARDAERMGARALVRKPVDVDQLRATIQHVAGLRVCLPGGERRLFGQP